MEETLAVRSPIAGSGAHGRRIAHILTWALVYRSDDIFPYTKSIIEHELGSLEVNSVLRFVALVLQIEVGWITGSVACGSFPELRSGPRRRISEKRAIRSGASLRR